MMKNKTNPFIITNVIIEDQLQQITSQLKALESASKEVYGNIFKQIKTAIRTIDRQHAHTRSIVHSALFEYEPGVAQAFADSQLAHQLIGQKVQDLAKTLTHCLSELEKATATALLIHQFNKYKIALHECLSREEVALLPILHRYYDETDLARMKVQVEEAIMSYETQASTLDLIY